MSCDDNPISRRGAVDGIWSIQDALLASSLFH
jgi:hypothetical protein